MGRNQQNNNPVDKTIYPESPPYVPPVKSLCDVIEMPIDVGDGNVIYLKQHVYRNLTVWFAIMHNYTVYGETHEIQRIDCCHSEVHEHIFSRTKPEYRKVLVEIDQSKNPWETVDAEYEPAYDRYIDNYEENQRRWRDD